jgi:restriction endonuclease Mrr
VIQAKRWTNTVQVDAVRDLSGVMGHEHAHKGIFITTSTFAPACYKFAERKPLQLIGGSNLLALIEEYTDDRCSSERVVKLIETVHTLLREPAETQLLSDWRDPDH